jgi:hypothetical protein
MSKITELKQLATGYQELAEKRKRQLATERKNHKATLLRLARAIDGRDEAEVVISTVCSILGVPMEPSLTKDQRLIERARAVAPRPQFGGGSDLDVVGVVGGKASVAVAR